MYVCMYVFMNALEYMYHLHTFLHGLCAQVRGMLKVHPDERLTTQQILQHPWIVKHTTTAPGRHIHTYIHT